MATKLVNVPDLLGEHLMLDVDDAGMPVTPLQVLDLDAIEPSAGLIEEVSWRLSERGGLGPVLVGVGTRVVDASFEPLLRQLAVSLAPGPSRCLAGSTADLDLIEHTVIRAPRSAIALAGLLRTVPDQPLAAGLASESSVYSMLLASEEFARWRASVPRRDVPVAANPLLTMREGGHLSVRLNRPERRNALGTQLRRALYDTLTAVTMDPTLTHLTLAGEGVAFSSGGDLDEFGTYLDPAGAHLDRLHHHVGSALHRLGQRLGRDLVVHVHGACVGGGIETAAFAPRIQAERDAWFLLPELAMGLIPGAGGTVSISHRIGPWRTAWMALTGRRVSADRALDWGLVDALC